MLILVHETVADNGPYKLWIVMHNSGVQLEAQRSLMSYFRTFPMS